MKCEICNKNEANVFIKQTVDGVSTKLHACQDCAREQGFEVKVPAPLLKDLLFGGGTDARSKPPPRNKKCPQCGMTAAEFRRGSLLGCPGCYDVFEEEVAPYLDSLPENSGHCGKAPAKERLATELTALQRSLKDAVEAQNFEEAARLRDRMKLLRGMTRCRREAEAGARRKGAMGELR